jgi:hypothetical protein
MLIGYVGWCEEYPCAARCYVCEGFFAQVEGQEDEYGHPILYAAKGDPVGTAVHNVCFWRTFTEEVMSGDLKEGQTIVADEEEQGIFLWKIVAISIGNGVVHWMSRETATGSYYQLDSKVRVLREIEG